MQADDLDVQHRHLVRSPDEVLLEVAVAGPASRIAAYAVDTLLLLLLLVVFVVLLVMIGSVSWATMGAWLERLGKVLGEGAEAGLASLFVLLLLGQLVAEVAYFVGWELAASGRTPGKMLLGLRVVRDGGIPLTPWASVVRNVLRAVDQLPMGYVVGLVACVVSRDAKRLGDMAAGTIVTRSQRPTPLPTIPAIDAARVDAVRLTSDEVARVDHNAVRLARSTLRRLATLDPERRAAVVAVAVGAIMQRTGRADPPIDPEAFLHAVVHAFDADRR